MSPQICVHFLSLWSYNWNWYIQQRAILHTGSLVHEVRAIMIGMVKCKLSVDKIAHHKWDHIPRRISEIKRSERPKMMIATTFQFNFLDWSVKKTRWVLESNILFNYIYISAGFIWQKQTYRPWHFVCIHGFAKVCFLYSSTQRKPEASICLLVLPGKDNSSLLLSYLIKLLLWFCVTVGSEATSIVQRTSSWQNLGSWSSRYPGWLD